MILYRIDGGTTPSSFAGTRRPSDASTLHGRIGLALDTVDAYREQSFREVWLQPDDAPRRIVGVRYLEDGLEA